MNKVWAANEAAMIGKGDTLGFDVSALVFNTYLEEYFL